MATTIKRLAPPVASRAALTEDELAAELGLSKSWLQHDRTGKRLLPFFRIGGRIRYNLPRVMQVLAQMEEGGVAA